MSLLGTLRKAGVIRYGAKAATWTRESDRPYELMSDDVYDAAVETVGGSKPAPDAACPKCGAPVRAGATFCGQCGHPLREAADPPPAPPGSTGSPSAASPPPPQRKKTNPWLIGCLVLVGLALLGIVAVIGLGVLIYLQTTTVTPVPAPDEPASTEQAARQPEPASPAAEPDAPLHTFDRVLEAGKRQTPPALNRPVSFEVFGDDTIGFTTQVPDDWEQRKVRGSIVFLGPATPGGARATLNFQATGKTAATSLQQQADDLIAQLQDGPDFELQASRTALAGGAPAAYLLATYSESGATFRQLQVIVDHGDLYLFIGYTAPAGLFDTHSYAMTYCLHDLGLFTPR